MSVVRFILTDKGIVTQVGLVVKSFVVSGSKLLRRPLQNLAGFSMAADGFSSVAAVANSLRLQEVTRKSCGSARESSRPPPYPFLVLPSFVLLFFLSYYYSLQSISKTMTKPLGVSNLPHLTTTG